MTITLRDYQTDILDRTRARMAAGCRSLLITSPTGSGKTALTAFMLKTAASKGLRSFFCVHRRELIRQSVRAFDKVGVYHGIIAANFAEDQQPIVQIASVQTLARRWHRFKKPALIVWDEAHHVAAKSWSDIHHALPEAFHVGLTATPERLDGRGLGAWFKEMIHGPTVEWLIANKFLASYKLYAPPGIGVEGIHKSMGEFAKSELAAAADKPTITGDAIKHYRRHADGKRALVFCVSIEHSKHVVGQFNAAGILAAHVDGDTPSDLRDRTITQFEAGQIQVLSNCALFGEGVDLPVLECVICLRPTLSLAMWLQMCGRGLRPSPGKSHAIILDHAGNAMRHGLPDDPREWSLEGRAGASNRENAQGMGVKVCPKCYAAQAGGKPACTYCGYVFETAPRKIETADGDLVEIDREALRRARLREQGPAVTEEALVALGIKRGYRRPRAWARFILIARRKKEAARAGI